MQQNENHIMCKERGLCSDQPCDCLLARFLELTSNHKLVEHITGLSCPKYKTLA